MLRAERGPWGPARRVALAMAPALVAAGLLVGSGDAPGAGSSRLEVGQAFSSPLPALLPPTPTAPAASAAAAPAPGPYDEAPPTGTDGVSPGDSGIAVTPQGGTAPGPAAPSVSSVSSGPAPATSPPGTPSLNTGTASAPAGATAASPRSAARPDDDATQAPDAAVAAAPTPAPAAGTTPARSGATTTTRPAAVTTTATPASGGAVRSAATEGEILSLTNRDRGNQGLGTLARNGCLDAAASGYAKEMSRTGVLAHHPGARAAVNDCRPDATWGDNVGTAVPCSASLLEERWMASPSHRRNILNGAFRLVGIGVWTDEGGECWAQVLFSS